MIHLRSERRACAAAAARRITLFGGSPCRGMSVFRGKAITISCTDLDRAAAFYQNVLGAVPLTGDGYGCQWYRLGALVFTLMPNAEAITPASFPRDAMMM